jgi:hypothetical protein
MSSATTSVATLSAYAEQPAPGAESRSQHTMIPEELWTVLILAVILWVLLAWRVIEKAGNGPRTARVTRTTAEIGFRRCEWRGRCENCLIGRC